VYATEAEFCGLDGERLIVHEGDPLAGKIIVKYRLEELLGTGANGCVYRATNLESATELAIKILFGEMACDRRVVARFRREAEAVSKMSHPNVVKIHDFGTAPSGLTYLAMELLVGRTLETAMAQDGRFSPDRAAGIAQQISAGLAEAHRLGFVHRDLKPGNVMLVAPREGNETAKILDFGIAMSMRRSEDEGRLTKTGYVVGTPLYMAPEQIDESYPLGPQADVYALGSILYEMLAGVPPFVGSVEQVLVKKMTRMPEPLLDCGEIGLLCMHLLERDPRLRPPTALHVSADIVRIIDDDPKTVLAPAPWTGEKTEAGGTTESNEVTRPPELAIAAPVPMFSDTSYSPTDVAMTPIAALSPNDSMITSTDMDKIDPAALFAQAALQPVGSSDQTLEEPRTALDAVIAQAVVTAPVPEGGAWTPGRLTYLIVAGTGIAIGLLGVLWMISR
jgi:serine/threonine protein kinase